VFFYPEKKRLAFPDLLCYSSAPVAKREEKNSEKSADRDENKWNKKRNQQNDFTDVLQSLTLRLA
jgi:hypothetical protein